VLEPSVPSCGGLLKETKSGHSSATVTKINAAPQIGVYERPH